MWNCTHFRHPTDEQLGHVDIFFSNYYNFSLSTLNTFNRMGFLIFKDPVSTTIQARKERVPGVLGSDVLRDMRKCLVSK